MKRVTSTLLRARPLPKPSARSDKEERGCALVIGGSRTVPGASVLSGVAALRAGAGRLQLAADRALTTQLGLAVPEAMVVPLSRRRAQTARPGSGFQGCVEFADAILIGPGMTEGPSTTALAQSVARTMSDAATLILDAGALTAATGRTRTVMTPHTGEMASLLGIAREEVEAYAPAVAKTAADRFGCIVVLKSATTFIAAEDEVYAFSGGSVGLATSGSGDVLAGIIAGLAARGADPLTSALWGVWAHGLAGRRLSSRLGRTGFLARELLAELPALLT